VFAVTDQQQQQQQQQHYPDLKLVSCCSSEAAGPAGPAEVPNKPSCSISLNSTGLIQFLMHLLPVRLWL